MSYFGHIKRHDSLEDYFRRKARGEKKKRQTKKSMDRRYQNLARNVHQRSRKPSL